MDKKRWLKQTISLTLIIASVYIILHAFSDQGHRLVTLTSSQIADISTLVNNNGTPQAKRDSAKDETEKGITSKKPNEARNEKILLINKINDYLQLAFNDQVQTDLKVILKNFDVTEFTTVLSSARIRLKSFFWLTGKLQAVEIVTWSLFGVLASLLYSVSESMRTGNYNSKEVAVHVAKLIYAPLCTIIIILSINVLSGEGDVDFEQFQYWLIVLSFTLGFFSGRTIELINKIKDLILPLGKATDSGSDVKLEISGKVNLEAQASGSKVDMSRVAVKLFSLNDPSLSSILNPNADGTFTFSGLKTGDFVVKAEYKNGADTLEASKSIALKKDESVDLSLQKN